MKSKFDFITKDLLQKERATGVTDKELSLKLGCSVGTISYKRNLYGITKQVRLQGIDISGMKYGNLTVLKEAYRKNKRVFWLCICDCGKETIIRGKDLRSGNTKSCGCLHYKSKENHYNWKGYKDISGRFWYDVQINAKNRGIVFDLKIEAAYELLKKQKFLCALSNIPLVVGVNASIDRIESSNGYNIENIQWSHRDINIIKWEYSEDYFLKLCNLVVENSKEEGSVEIWGNRSKKYTGVGNISGDQWFNIRNNAKIRNIEFNVSIKEAWDIFVHQKGKCALSGLPIGFEKRGGRRTHRTASLDRKNSAQSYNLENIWWVHKDINNIKWKLDLDYFLSLCSKIVQKQRNSHV